jgi:hypothetical protein
MKGKIFYILSGNNGATYIINTSGWNSISESLKFYRAHSVKSKILKAGLKGFLWLKNNFYPSNLKNNQQVQEYLQSLCEIKIDFHLNWECSVLVSPTRDKIIVNHHQKFFQKFAFGKSYNKVKNEAGIYNLFVKPLKNFQVSQYVPEVIGSNEFCSFKLFNSHLETNRSEDLDLVPALVEFFKVSQDNSINAGIYVESLIDRIKEFELELNGGQIEFLKQLKEKYASIKIPLGLVHRDFKPWNIIQYQKILIFDFEEAITDGLPLEDILNYYCDPIVRYKHANEVAEVLLDEFMIGQYYAYLEDLNISIDFKLFLHMYLIERILFWHTANELETSKAYLKLSNYLLQNTKV